MVMTREELRAVRESFRAEAAEQSMRLFRMRRRQERGIEFASTLGYGWEAIDESEGWERVGWGPGIFGAIAEAVATIATSDPPAVYRPAAPALHLPRKAEPTYLGVQLCGKAVEFAWPVFDDGGVTRRIAHGALTWDNELTLNWHHEDDVLASVADGSLVVWELPTQLFWKAWLYDTPTARDVLERLQSGERFGCSVHFIPTKETSGYWCDMPTRDVRAGELGEISVCCEPDARQRGTWCRIFRPDPRVD